ncbi:hypothetical protein SUGI_0484070 [Cryptomeria japonica]|nr:hypothetical protein SUGI_0484070 [Cryptomeria japonica]
MENPLPDQNKNITSNASLTHDNCPPVAYTEENNNNKSSNISDLDKIIDEANSIKDDALVEMTKRISDSVDSLKFPSESKSVENLGQDNEADQEEMSSRMVAALEVFDNNVVENLSLEEEAEKRFLIQELLSSMEEEEIIENRVGDIIPNPVNDYTVAQSLDWREIHRGDQSAWYPDGDTLVRSEYNPSTAFAYGCESKLMPCWQ